jgi:hypothetical protein
MTLNSVGSSALNASGKTVPAKLLMFAEESATKKTLNHDEDLEG